MKLTLPYLLVAVNLALGSAAYAESTPSSYDGDSSDAATVASSVCLTIKMATFMWVVVSVGRLIKMLAALVLSIATPIR